MRSSRSMSSMSKALRIWEQPAPRSCATCSWSRARSNCVFTASGAVVTWLTGAGYLLHLGRLQHAFALGTLEGSNPADFIIGVGAWLGTIMLFNVWVLIWPNQKKVLGIVKATPEEIAKAKTVALLASRTNTLLSIPMIMSMVGYGHAGFFI